MSDSYNTRIKLKRDTEGNWTSKNPILLDGEMIIVKTNDGKIRKKIGDGVKKFSELPYDEIAIDSATSTTSTNPVQNKVITLALAGKAGTAVATTSASGLMSASDKSKLDGIATGANKTDVDSSLSSESIRPVQNRVVKSALDGKLDKTGGTLTGNLTGKYITGTWLQSTAATNLHKTPGKIAVLDDTGWVYYRTPSEILDDIGGASQQYVDDHAGGSTRVNLSGTVEGEVKGYTSTTYQQIVDEIAKNGNIWLTVNFQTMRLASWKRSGSADYILNFLNCPSSGIATKYEVIASTSSASLSVTGSY